MSLLIYGAPGIGKSTLVSRLAWAAESFGSPACLIDTENGLYSAARGLNLNRTELLSATSSGDGKAVLERLADCKNQPPGLIAVDTMSELSEMILRDAAGLLDTPQLQHYGTRKAVLSRCVRALRDTAFMGGVAVATFQQEAKEIEGLTGHWRPSLPEKSAVDAIAQFDCVARLRIVQDHEADRMKLEAGCRYLDFRPSSQQTAKCRTASEIFGGRDASWHIWPIRNEMDIADLYQKLARITEAKQEGTKDD
tara:strand:+ start:9596 stop:10351 length:756 start_codon:yes stop_codon:yes gene_type:complete